MAQCLTKGCGCERTVSRGLCHRCYYRLAYRVAKNKTTWDDLVDQGEALPATGTFRSAEDRRNAILAVLEFDKQHGLNRPTRWTRRQQREAEEKARTEALPKVPGVSANLPSDGPRPEDSALDTQTVWPSQCSCGSGDCSDSCGCNGREA